MLAVLRIFHVPTSPPAMTVCFRLVPTPIWLDGLLMIVLHVSASRKDFEAQRTSLNASPTNQNTLLRPVRPPMADR